MIARRLSASARAGPAGPAAIAAARMRSASRYSDRSMNRHSAASWASRSRRLGVVVRRQPARVLVEARGGERRAAQPGVPGGVGERRGDGRVGAVGRLGEVPGAGVRGRRRGGEGLVRRPQLGRARERRDALGEQRVAEPHGVAVDRHEVVLDRRAKVVREPRRRRLERRQRRLRRGGREEHRPARSSRQQREAARDQRAQAVGHGQRVVRVGRDPAPDERAAHLERIERVPARRLLDADEDEARERPAQAELEQPMQRREVQRPDGHALEPVGRDRADDLVGRLRLGPRPDREQERDRPIGQPPDRVGEDRRRALVEELDVVDRDDDRAIRFDELAEQPRDGDRQRPLIGRRAARRRAQERDRERVALRRGQAARTSSPTPPRRSTSPPSVRPCSDCAGRDVTTSQPRSAAASAAACQTVDLPIPASPSKTSAASPSPARARNGSSAASSGPRPTISWATARNVHPRREVDQ